MPRREPETHVGPQLEDHVHDGTDVVLRAPKTEDLDELVQIDASWVGRERRAYLAGRLKRAMRPAGVSLARVAERTGNVVGFLFGEVTWGEFGRAEGAAWVDTVGVSRRQLRGGIASALLSDFLRHAEVLGVESVRTLLEPENDDLTEFLQAHGFRVAKTRVVERRVR